MVMTDWCGAYNTLHSLKAGLNLEMPAAHAYSFPKSSRLLARHKITVALINQRVRPILRLMVAMGFNDPNNPFNHRRPNISSDAAVVNQIAAEGTVLLKNHDHILPLNPSRRMNVVFIGPWATRVVTGGGGSSHVTPNVKPLTLFNAVRQVVGPNVHLTSVPWSDTYRRYWGRGALTTPDDRPGVVADYYANGGFGGKPTQVIQRNISLDVTSKVNRIMPGTGNASNKNLMKAIITAAHRAGIGKSPVSAIWKAVIRPRADGEYCFICAVNGSAEVYLDGRRIIDLWLPFWQNPVHPLKGAVSTIRLHAGETYQVRVVYRSFANKPGVIGFGWVPRKTVHFFTSAQRRMIHDANIVIACMGFNQTIQRE